MNSQKVRKYPLLSFPRTRESREINHFWTPAFAGVTALEPFYEAIKLVLDKSYDDTWNVSVLPIKMTEL